MSDFSTFSKGNAGASAYNIQVLVGAGAGGGGAYLGGGGGAGGILYFSVFTLQPGTA